MKETDREKNPGFSKRLSKQTSSNASILSRNCFCSANRFSFDDPSCLSSSFFSLFTVSCCRSCSLSWAFSFVRFATFNKRTIQKAQSCKSQQSFRSENGFVLHVLCGNKRISNLLLGMHNELLMLFMLRFLVIQLFHCASLLLNLFFQLAQLFSCWVPFELGQHQVSSMNITESVANCLVDLLNSTQQRVYLTSSQVKGITDLTSSARARFCFSCFSVARMSLRFCFKTSCTLLNSSVKSYSEKNMFSKPYCQGANNI